MLNKLALYLVAHNSAHDTGEWLVNRMNIVDMHVQSLLAGNKFDANVAEIVVNLPRHAPPALLYVGDERIT